MANHPNRSKRPFPDGIPQPLRGNLLRSVLAPHFAATAGWSEDPMIVLRALAKEARDMIEFHKGMGLHSVAYWEFVATECDQLADRIHEKWSSE